VIPKNSAIAVVAFIPSDTLDPVSPHTTRRFGWFRPSPNAYSTYEGAQLKTLFSGLTVSVAGTHVQEANPSQPTLKLFIPSTANNIQLSPFKAGPSLTIQGSGLDGVAQVQLSNATDGKTVIAAKLQPLQSETSIDPNVVLLTIPSVATATIGAYDITFILADGTAVKTAQSITVIPDPPNISPTQGIATTSVTITGTGFGTTKGTVMFSGTAGTQTISATPTNWSDTTITVAVPPLAATGNVVVTTNAGASQTTGIFTVP
jgi:hypothetical protein